MSTKKAASTETCRKGYAYFKAHWRSVGFTLGDKLPRMSELEHSQLFDRICLYLSVKGCSPVIAPHTYAIYRAEWRSGRMDYIPSGQQVYNVDHGPVDPTLPRLIEPFEDDDA